MVDAPDGEGGGVDYRHWGSEEERVRPVGVRGERIKKGNEEDHM
jgi:hypothetical protein